MTSCEKVYNHWESNNYNTVFGNELKKTLKMGNGEICDLNQNKDKENTVNFLNLLLPH